MLHLAGHHDGERGQRRLVCRAEGVVHQPEGDRIGAIDHLVPEGEGMPLTLDGVILAFKRVDDGIQCVGSAGTAPSCRQASATLGPLCSRVSRRCGPPRRRLRRPGRAAGQQFEPAVLTEVAHGRGVTLPDLDQSSFAEPLDRFADRRPGHAEGFGEPSFAGQGLAGGRSPPSTSAMIWSKTSSVGGRLIGRSVMSQPGQRDGQRSSGLTSSSGLSLQ